MIKKLYLFNNESFSESTSLFCYLDFDVPMGAKLKTDSSGNRAFAYKAIKYKSNLKFNMFTNYI